MNNGMLVSLQFNPAQPPSAAEFGTASTVFAQLALAFKAAADAGGMSTEEMAHAFGSASPVAAVTLSTVVGDAAVPVPTAATTPAPVPTPPTTGEAQNHGVDATGLPWDARIHNGDGKKNDDGKWKKKRGATPTLVAQVEAELMARAASGVGTPAPVPAPPAAPAVPTPPSAVPTPPAVPAPPAAAPVPTPPAATAPSVTSTQAIVNGLMSGALTIAEVQSLIGNAMGLPAEQHGAIQTSALSANPALADTIAKHLRDNGRLA